MKQLILIGYKARHGKDTVAEILKEELSKTQNVDIIRFADPLKAIAADALGLSLEELDDYKNETTAGREFLQKLGSGKLKEYFGQNVWADIAKQRVLGLLTSTADTIIIPDFRFPNEALNLEEFQIKVSTVKIYRPNHTITAAAHVSETALDSYEFDYELVNSSTLEYLKSQAIELSGNFK